MRSIKIKSRINDYIVEFKTLTELEKICDNKIVVIDNNVYKYYKQYFSNCDLIKMNCIEETKSLDGTAYILNEFVKRKIKSNANIIIVGGGILQDVAGFACSVYCRGIKYTLFPTTLLSQCDSCIGGKTSINFSSIKNILGTFYPPENIYICTEFLKTLSSEDYASGLGEIIKFNLLKYSMDWFVKKDIKKDVEELIFDSLSYKNKIIEIDEFDKKERKFLNFGHTFGHALEISSNYSISHGTAVLFGILIANKVAVRLGYLKKDYYFETIINFTKHQKISKEWFNFSNLIEIIKLDKKNTGQINMILLSKDEPILTKIEDVKILEEALNEVYESVRLHN